MGFGGNSNNLVYGDDEVIVNEVASVRMQNNVDELELERNVLDNADEWERVGEEGLLRVDGLQDEQNGPVRPLLDDVNGFGTMSYGGNRDGGARAPPSFNFNFRGGIDGYLAEENLEDVQGDGLSNQIESRIQIESNECIESDGPDDLGPDNGQ